MSADRRLLSDALRSRKESDTAEFKHDHPGQKEPRAPGEIHHENRIVDLNTAPEEELADMPMVGPKRARELMQHRPFKLWDDVQKVLGFDTGMVDDLKSGGARIGSQNRRRRRL